MPYTITKTRKKQPPKESTTNEGLVTYKEYYEIIDEREKADLLDGKIIRDSPAIPRHAHVVTRITTLIGNYAEKFNLGEVIGATTTVRLSAYQGPEPDILFISRNRLGIMADRYVDGPPDLCVEVISRSSRKRDRGRKFVLYADHGVREYWIIDPLYNTIDCYENRGGEWIPIQPDDDGRLHSKVLPDFWLHPRWLGKTLMPPVSDILDEILGGQRP